MLAVARAESSTGFGGFAIAYSIYLVIFGVARALIGETLSVTAASSNEARAGRQAMGAAALLGLALALAVGGGAMVAFSDGAIRQPLLAFAALLPLVLTQDAARFAGFAKRRATIAVRGDGTWLLAQLATMAALARMGRTGAVPLILVWGMAAFVGTLAMLPTLGRPRFGASGHWIRTHFGMGRSFGVEFLVQATASHGTLYVVGFLIGLPAAGALRAAQSLYGPVNSLFMGIGAALTPQATRAAFAGHASYVGRLASKAVIGFGAIAASATLIVIWLPDHLGTLLLGVTWEQTQQVALPVGLVMVGLGIISGVRLGLRAFHAVRSSLLLRVSLGLLGLLLGSSGAMVGGVVGAAYGLALAHVLCGLLGSVMLIRLRTSRMDSARGDGPR